MGVKTANLATLLRISEKAYAVLILLLLTGARKSHTLFIVFSPLILLLVILQWKGIIRISLKEKLFWVFIGLVVTSVLWSAAPNATLTRSFALVQTTLFGAYLAVRYSMKEQLQLLAWALGIVALLSFFVALAFPQQGIMQVLHEGAWRGILGQKNVLGRIMVLSTLVFLLLALSSRKHSLLLWAGFSLSFLLILLSTSKTALVVLLTLLVLLPLYRALRWSYSWMVPFLSAVVLVGGSVAVLLVSSAENILHAMGKDLTLSGRTDLWAAVLNKIWERPWFGYGYGGFWLGWNGESADIWMITGWRPPHTHNGLLEVWLALGLVGVMVFIAVFIATFLRAAVWLRLSKSAIDFWPLLYLSLLLLLNLTESTFSSKTIFWTLYVATILSTHTNPVSKTQRKSLQLR